MVLSNYEDDVYNIMREKNQNFYTLPKSIKREIKIIITIEKYEGVCVVCGCIYI